MKIHEYQGKEILKKFRVAVPPGKVAFSVEEAVQGATEIGGDVWRRHDNGLERIQQFHPAGSCKVVRQEARRSPQEVRIKLERKQGDHN